MDIASWQAQLRKGATELVVLSILIHGEAYGLQILQAANANGDLVTDGALYPLLSRLEKSGKIAAHWVIPDGGGNPRKYYELTLEGRALVTDMQTVWVHFRTNIAALVEDNDA
ncbi:PadR family transcriptional regulator [Sphingomonas abietis]|uniref:PadR family transcriptional regulator n=1 Tax=Sphingomonas abietis TaxID=3012344 RepID=A0ABY7NL01_9SPHN|nr:PadR family transcriptional regulator [Sphingomonas abietis]WBO21480.1 PadR family transcriptional regulator [Sphingomonas abietis]